MNFDLVFLYFFFFSQLSNLNLANGAVNQGFNPAYRPTSVATGPPRAVHSDARLTNGLR